MSYDSILVDTGSDADIVLGEIKFAHSPLRNRYNRAYQKMELNAIGFLLTSHIVEARSRQRCSETVAQMTTTIYNYFSGTESGHQL